MENYYERYQMADNLLELIIRQSNKQFRVKNLSKAYITSQIVELSEINNLVRIVNEGKYEVIRLTPEGEAHLAGGGYTSMFGLQEKSMAPVSFKQHLEDNANLLSIFGILNAVILFAGDVVRPTVGKLNLLDTGKQFVSFSMYLLSILVLIEIIQHTLIEGGRTWKYQAFYFFLCMTTLGIGAIFIDRYGSIFYVLAFMGAYSGLVDLIFRLFWRLMLKLPIGSLRRIEAKSKLAIAALMVIAILIASLILKEVLKYLLSP